MSSENKDCATCKHAVVCQFVKTYRTLAKIGGLAFNCNYYLGMAGTQKKESEDRGQYADMSVDELSRMMDEGKDSKSTHSKGICAICKKESERLYECDHCHKLVCGNCAEIEEELAEADPVTGQVEAKEIILCKNCQGGDAS